MTATSARVGAETFRFGSLRELLAKASPGRAADRLAGIAAGSERERVAAQRALADVPLKAFLAEPLIDPEHDEVSRLIHDGHDAAAFAPVSTLTVGAFREHLLRPDVDAGALASLASGLTPEMVAAVSKLMRAQELVAVARKARVVTSFRTTLGLPGRLSTRLQPNHPTDDPLGIVAATLDGLLLGCGDAVVGVNPATDRPDVVRQLLDLLESLRLRYDIPIQSCVLAHVTTTLEVMAAGAPVDLVFQSIAGTEAANRAFGVNLAILREAREAAHSQRRGGRHVMYFETGQGAALSSGGHHGVDAQTVEARAYAVARAFEPLLVNTVVGFIGPEYLADGREIHRAGLEDHFCGKLLGLPMGCDVCHTNHADAGPDDVDGLLVSLAAAGCTFFIGVPGSDDIMLGYQSASFHDLLLTREILGLAPAPEFEAWLVRMEIDPAVRVAHPGNAPALPPSATAAIHHALPAWMADSSGFVSRLRTATPARVALPRAGVAIATAPTLDLREAHAEARDAVHEPWDPARFAADLLDRLPDARVIIAPTGAGDRTTHLARPDLGRRLSALGRERLADTASDVVWVVSDGLSARAVVRHAVLLLGELARVCPQAAAPLVVLCPFGRVAIADEVGPLVGARLAVVMLGERPGLSAADSLGVYLTFDPRPGRTDAERNCISNVRVPGGLDYATAAVRLATLLGRSLVIGCSGVSLKDTSPHLCGSAGAGGDGPAAIGEDASIDPTRASI